MMKNDLRLVERGMIFFDKSERDTYLILDVGKDQKGNSFMVYWTYPEGIDIWRKVPDHWMYVEHWTKDHRLIGE